MRHQDRDPFVVSEDVKAVLVPAGIEVKLRKAGKASTRRNKPASTAICTQPNPLIPRTV